MIYFLIWTRLSNPHDLLHLDDPFSVEEIESVIKENPTNMDIGTINLM
jgi:hypothetical protein